MSATTHVIFDFAQTLIDCISTFNAVLKDYAQSKGKEWKDNMLSVESGSSEFLRDVLIKMGDDSYKDPEKLEEFKKYVFTNAYAKGYQMLPGVDKLIRHLHKNNIPMAIATDGTLKMLKDAFKITTDFNQGLFSHFSAGADDPEVKLNKPAPDVYLVCAKRFNPPPKSIDSCVVFEDSILGITGGVASGMKTVLINSTPVDKIGAIAGKITVIVDSMKNFKPESVGLPPYDKNNNFL